MIELERDSLVLRFPEVHKDAVLEMDFQRTLRIPDDERDYPLPPGLGRFPLRHVDDFAARLPVPWLRRGGVMLPMYQAEAMWLDFSSPSGYPFAVLVAAGKVNAVTGEAWTEKLSRDPQNYLPIPEQPWLDGFVVEKGTIRQFVAMRLGAGYTAEEQITGTGEFGGLQLKVFPLRRERWHPRPRARARLGVYEYACYSLAEPAPPDMGLGAGGRMHQEIYEDHRPLDHWDVAHTSRCFVHLMNSLVWRAVTGAEPPTVPLTAAEYARHGLPWFEYYSEATAVSAQEVLRKLKSIGEIGREKGGRPLPENERVEVGEIVRLRAALAPGQVREGSF